MAFPQPVAHTSTRTGSDTQASRQSRHRARKPRPSRFRSLGWEVASKVVVNGLLSAIAIHTVIRLVPHYQTQRQALAEVEASVETAEQQLEFLRSDFSRYFDPSQPGQRIPNGLTRETEDPIPVVLVDPLSVPPSESEN